MHPDATVKPGSEEQENRAAAIQPLGDGRDASPEKESEKGLTTQAIRPTERGPQKDEIDFLETVFGLHRRV